MDTPILVRRRDAAQATLDRFRGRRFAFGSSDCARLIAYHLRQLGHRPPLSKGGSYNSALGARAALRRSGYASMGEALDALGLMRIPPAAALIGDILQGASGDVLGAYGIALGNNAMLGYHEDADGAAVLRAIEIASAWRADPR